MSRILITTLFFLSFIYSNNSVFAQNKANTVSNAVIELTYDVTDENRAIITWYVSERTNPVRYVIQRSRDDVNYFDIKTIEVKPNINKERLGYSFVDPKALKYQEYFRIIEYNSENNLTYYEAFVLKPKSPVSFVSSVTGNGIVRIIVSDTKSIKALLSTNTNLGIPCDYLVEKDNESVILKPKYMLPSGNYKVSLKTLKTNNEYNFTVKNDDI